MTSTTERKTLLRVRFLRLPEVLERTGLSRSTIYVRLEQGRFPRPVSLGARAVGWIESEVDEWIRERIEESRDGAGSPGKPPRFGRLTRPESVFSVYGMETPPTRDSQRRKPSGALARGLATPC